MEDCDKNCSQKGRSAGNQAKEPVTAMLIEMSLVQLLSQAIWKAGKMKNQQG